jgi:hypothetical protein
MAKSRTLFSASLHTCKHTKDTLEELKMDSLQENVHIEGNSFNTYTERKT